MAIEEIEKMNLYQKMIKVTEELGKVGKNLEVKGGDGRVRYNAVGETDVLDKVKPLETKYHIYSYPLSRRYVDLPLSGKVALRVETIYRFVNADTPSEYIDITSYGDGLDSGDKAPGKAMTYSDKYALMKAYKISTGDDPDQDPSPEPLISAKQASYLKDLLKPHPEIHVAMLGNYNVSKIDFLTSAQGSEAIDRVKKNIEKKMARLQNAENKPVEKPTETKVEEVKQSAEKPAEPVETKPVEKVQAEVKAEVKNEEPKSETEKVEMIDVLQKAKILAGMNEERRTKMLKAYKKTSLEELTKAEADKVLAKLAKETK